MELLDKFKLWYTCKSEGRIEEYKEYKNCAQRLESDVKMYSGFLNEAIQKFTEIQQSFPENSEEYSYAKRQVYRWQQTLDGCELQLKFVRPNSQQDIEYRNKQCEVFVKRLQSTISPNLDLRFHGTPSYFAEQIIRSGTISSTADRYDGYIKSTDMKGEISVSTAKTLGRTIDIFSDMMAYQRCLPAGCIFALFPKDAEDARYGQDLMHSVDFRKNPEQLFGVFTTPENTEAVKQWMNESGLSSEIVYTFEQFLEVVKAKSNMIDEQVKRNTRCDESKTDEMSFSEKDNTLVTMNNLVKSVLEQGITDSEINYVDTERIQEQPTKEGVILDEK